MQIRKTHKWGIFVIAMLSVMLIGFSFACDGDDNGDDNGYSTDPNGNNQPGENEVWMQNTAFVPSELTVSTGTTVTWVNKDAFTHTVTSGAAGNPTDLFDSGNMGENDTFSFTFQSEGTFPYFCKIHPNQMTGTITVE